MRVRRAVRHASLPTCAGVPSAQGMHRLIVEPALDLAPSLQTGELPLVMKPHHNDGHGAQQGGRQREPCPCLTGPAGTPLLLWVSLPHSHRNCAGQGRAPHVHQTAGGALGSAEGGVQASRPGPLTVCRHVQMRTTERSPRLARQQSSGARARRLRGQSPPCPFLGSHFKSTSTCRVRRPSLAGLSGRSCCCAALMM